MQQLECRILPLHTKQHNSSFRKFTLGLQIEYGVDKIAIIRGVIYNNLIKAAPSGGLILPFLFVINDILVKSSVNNDRLQFISIDKI